MPKHMLKVLTLLPVFAMAPASAANRIPTVSPTSAIVGWSDDSVACPYERARRAAARQADAARRRPTTITLTDRVPTDAPLLGRGSAFINP